MQTLNRLCLLCAFLFLSACGGGSEPPRQGPPQNATVVADAGGPYAPVIEGDEVVLQGAASGAQGETFRFRWEQTDGPAVALTGADTASARFIAPEVERPQQLIFTLTVTGSSGGEDTDTARVQVLDTPPSLSIADASAAEAEGVMRFPVSLSRASEEIVTVQFATADGSAVAGTDYVASSGTLEFPAGETLAQIEVALLDAGTQVPQATFTVTLSEPDNARLARAVATGTILNSTVFACPDGQFCAGAAKRSVAPSDRHIEGVIEERLSADAEGRVGEKRQQFNLGGYGDVGAAPDSTDVDIGGPAATGNYAVAGEDGEAHSTYVRALVLELDGQTVAFVTLDAIGAGNLIQAGMKRAISAASGIAEDNILIGQSHSHSAADLQGLWGGVPDTWLDCDADRFGLDGCGEADAWTQGLYQLAAAAVQEAHDRRAPAELLSATGQAQRNNFRRPKIRPDEQTDQALTVLQARRADGTVIGTLMQYTAHPTVLGLSNRQVHTDFVLSGLVRLEQAQGGVALYFNGPIADASPRTPPDSEMPAALRCSGLAGVENGYCRARNLGIRIADDALQILQSAAQPVSPVLTVRHATAVLPVTNPLFIAAGAARSFNRYYNFVETPADQIPQVQALRAELPQLTPTASTQVSRITLGTPLDGAGLEIVTIPGEATNSFGQMIRRQAYGAEGAASRPMMLLGLTHNSFGYIIPEEEFGGPVNGEAPYEETVSLGPLTAPLLRLQAYYPLFGTPQDEQTPEYLSACRASPDDPACVLQVLEDRALTGALACLDPGSPQCPAQELLELFGDGLDELEKGCRDREFPPQLCDTVAQVGDALEGGGDERPAGDEALLTAAFDAQLRGCDLLDPASCLFPFPSDHYTVPAAAGSPQSVERGGTGRRIRFLPQAMPRNILGKPVDPSEWNRNDGFSPGQMILTYVPGLGVERDAANQPFGPVRGAVPLTDLSRVDDPDAAVVVLEVPDNAVELPRRHLVWAEIDLNAGLLLPSEGQANPAQAARPALIVRPAQNFREGRRYVVVLRNLRDDAGRPLAAQPAFATCRDGRVSLLPPVVSRCQALEQNVFGVLDRAGIARDDRLYLAWDFTTASAENNIARLRHMRDDAFAALGQVETPAGEITDLGRAPTYTVTAVQENPNSLIARRVTGTFTVPSYLVPADASPLNESEQFQAFLAQLAANQPQQLEMLRSECRRFAPVGEACDVFTPGRAAALGSTVSAPPNRLHYQPDAASAGACAGLTPEQAATSGCAAQAAYGDGLPDRPGGNATLTVNFTCNIPKAALDSPARPSLYGHGLLGGQGEVNNGEHVATLAQEGNMMLCATDWYGFASGDVPNVASVLVDLSNFPVIPDASQQGVLNFLYLARLLRHPGGFAADPAFQFDGRPAHDTREVFYDGNSQGGILGGVVVAASKDVQRGVLGVPGMNYSTLLTRSVDFDIYSIPLYLAYPDDLDRNIAFSLMQMLWDRSENNGYAHHITDNRAFKGPDNEVLLHVGFADHQVTMWSADVMARTIGAPVDRSRVVGADRHPDHDEYFRLPALDYQDPAQAQGSALLVWDQPWSSGRCGNNSTPTPPVGNVPPRDGADPHECPRRERVARCQKAHFLQREGRLIDVPARDRDAPAFVCPAIEPITDAPPAGEPAAPGAGPLDALLSCLDKPTAPGCPLSPVLLAADDGLDQLAKTCEAQAGPLQPACAVPAAVADLIVADGGGEEPPPPPSMDASCVRQENLQGNRSYAVRIHSASGETISFQVLEPRTFNCAQAAAGAHPLILHGHGFGGARSTSGFAEYRDAGYAVISIDQRGFGASSGTVRVMDPDFEGQDLIRILDWAEQHLDYLAWRDEGQPGKPFAPRPGSAASVDGGPNLVVGAIGSSYGGGFQLLLHAVDVKNRLDALAPDITWHDLRYSLNPGDVVKSAWDVLLTAGGEAGSYGPGLAAGETPDRRGLDPYIKETLVRGAASNEFPREALDWFQYHSPSYWCGLNGQATLPYDLARAPTDPNGMLGTLAGDVPGGNQRRGQPAVDVLLSQGMRDTLFNFNDAWFNYQCLKQRGGDVRLITHQSGHILQGFVPAPGPFKFQETGGNNNCGSLNRGAATLQWFNEKLRGQAPGSQLAGTGDALCLSLDNGDAVQLPVAQVLAPRAADFPAAQRAYVAAGALGARNVVQGAAAQALYDAQPGPAAVIPVLGITPPAGAILAGIPQARVRVSTPQGVNDSACAQAGVPTLRTGCDSIVFIGLGVKAAGASAWRLVDDQLMPVRGLGEHANVHLVGVAERLRQGDELAVLVYGYHPQYLASYSRDATIPAVHIELDLDLPLYPVGADGQPDFTADVENSLVRVQPPPAAAARPDYGPGLIGILAGFTGGLGEALGLLVQGEFETALNNLAAALQSLLTQLLALVAGDSNSVAVLVAHAADNLQAGDAPALVEDAGDDLGNVIGLDADPVSAVQREAAVRREVEPVVLTGAQLPLWSVPAAQGAPYPYPSGALLTGELFDQLGLLPGQVQDAHNGVILYPPPGAPPELMGPAPERLAAFAWDGSAFVEIPVQVDQKFPFFLANANSDFSTYSGTDEELTYEWDLERWDNSNPEACFASYLPGKRDPVSGLDHDDEIVFMAADAGTAAPAAARPPGLDPAQPVQEVALFDPLQPGSPRYVYLGLKPASGRAAFAGSQHYVRYERDPNADQWIDRGFFTENDPEKLGTSNTGYGPNRSGKVCPDGTDASKRNSTDRFPRDGVTVSTDTYRWYASGRWMIREIQIAQPDRPAEYGPDLLDRWKGRAFQQSPDSTISVVGFEDEQVNWEGNSTLLGERAGPVRAIREVWGADSGTNVTKTETFYRDAVAYRYRVRVHPIPPDGLYTSWDYNRSAMVPEPGEAVPGGRYYTALRPHGVPVDGINDDLGQLDNLFPVNGQCLTPEGPRAPDITGRCPAFFDVADPTFNAPLAFDNWEQVSAKGSGGSLVYVFELKGATSLANPLVVPYYRDDACLDDGTGDDPVPRPFPGESYSWNGGKVPAAYDAMAGRPLDHTGRVFADCIERQGAHASHGIHYFFTHDTDNSFVLGKPNNEVDAEQWQFMVPSHAPENLGAAYANVVRARLQAVILPRPPSP